MAGDGSFAVAGGGDFAVTGVGDFAVGTGGWGEATTRFETHVYMRIGKRRLPGGGVPVWGDVGGISEILRSFSGGSNIADTGLSVPSRSPEVRTEAGRAGWNCG